LKARAGRIIVRAMRFLGATQDEILFVAFLIMLVLVAPKVPRIGERIGQLFERRRRDKPAEPRGSRE
jgi:hypothetical protein